MSPEEPKTVEELIVDRARENAMVHADAIAEALYGAHSRVTPPRKPEWYEGAEYTYGNFEQNGETVRLTTIITFKFPNAAGGPVEFSDWLYRTRMDSTGQPHMDKNLTAEMLQCYIDEENLR